METIRKATPGDLPAMLTLFEQARGIMRQDGNMTQWPDGTIHRLASGPESKGIADACFKFCWNRISNLRIDTHADNRIMQHCISKFGFRRCGIIHLANGEPRIERLITFILSFILFVNSSQAMQKQKIHITTDDGHRMKVLIYRPDSNTDSLATGVLWIHGGGYITGMASMTGMMGMGPRLVKDHGCVVISPEYRLGKKGHFPNALNDCYAALKYMVGHAEELGIRKDKTFCKAEGRIMLLM